MEARCKKCGYTTTFSPSKVKNITTDAIQIDIFGNKEKVIAGKIKCSHCGAVIYTDRKEELIKKEKNILKE